MAVKQELRIITAEQQRTIIRSVRDLQDYRQVYEEVYPEDVAEYWMSDLSIGLAKVYEAQVPREMYQLLTIIGYQFGQLGGIRSLQGQEHRHRQKGWRRTLYSPEHQIALAGYAGNVSNQADNERSKLFDQIGGVDRMVDQGIPGLRFGIERGGIIGYFYNDADSMRVEARKRYVEGRSIYQTDREINDGFVALNFSGDTADKIAPTEFAFVLRKLTPSLHPVFEPEGLLRGYRRATDI